VGTRVAIGLALVVLTCGYVEAGLVEGREAYERGDYATALREFLPLAREGNVWAQFYVGAMYDNDQGVPQDYAEAARWYRRAAEQGHADAQFNLAVIYYFYFQGQARDYAEAARWYRRAAEQGHAEAQAVLGLVYLFGHGVSQDYVQAYMWLELGALRLPPGIDYDEAVNARDVVATRMTPLQIDEAQRLAREWKPKPEKAP